MDCTSSLFFDIINCEGRCDIMHKKNKIKSLLILLLVLSLFCINIDITSAAYTEDKIGTYEEELSKFPDDYKSKIEALHQIYPNAIFVAQDKFFDWDKKEEVNVDWNRMLGSQYYEEGGELSFNNRSRNLIEDNPIFDVGYRSNASWAYDYYTDTYTRFDSGRWFAAAKGTIAYYMDPRNFLDSTYVFMFESNLYHDYQTIEGVEKILNNTFMSNKVCSCTIIKEETKEENAEAEKAEEENTIVKEEEKCKKYSEVIMEAAKANDVSPYMIASRLRQEQGTKGTSPLISGKEEGYEGYYNYFNVGASGEKEEVVINGLKYAKAQGWDSVEKAINGGTAFIKNEYVGINDEYNVKGQLTGYLQKFDPYGWKLGGHQYMQNITGHYTEASSTYNSYASQEGYKDFKYIFYIPIYSNMPSSTELPKIGSPNNYLSSITVDGALVKDFDGAKTEYTYTVATETDSVVVDYLKVGKYATVTGAGEIALDSDNKKISLVVTAQNGDEKTYNLTIKKSSTGALSVGAIINKAAIKSDGTYLSGFDLNTTVSSFIEKLKAIDEKVEITILDSNNKQKTEGILSTGDNVTIKSGNETKTFAIVIYGDVNGDGLLDSTDLLRIRQQLIGIKQLSGANYQAANITRDNVIDSTDLLRMRQHLIGIKTISQ